MLAILFFTGLFSQVLCSRPFKVEPPSDAEPLLDESLRGLTIDRIIRRVLENHKSEQGLQNPERMAMLMSGDASSILAELDMVLTPDQFGSLYSRNQPERRGKRKVYQASKPWTNGTIPYVINPWDFSGNERAIIHLAIQEWEQYTCVKFRPSNSADRNKLIIQNGFGCNSQLGEVGGAQALNLEAPGCRFKGLYLHELGHALGLVHEHQLPDRDNHIEVLWNNVKQEWRQWFNKYNNSQFTSDRIPYDLASVMHYGVTAFSKDDKSITIRAKDSSQNYRIGEVYKKELSFLDIKTVNTIYDCAAHCPTNIRCSDGGFVDRNCRCYCSDGTNKCQTSPTVAVITKPACKNKHTSDADCDKWAGQDQCSLNPLWMIDNCQRSCKKCDVPVEPTPLPKLCANRESDAECDMYAKAGECGTSPSWMFYNCKASCGWCSQADGCRDLYPDSNQCLEWKSLGQCDRNPAWMWANCRKTCDVCGSKPVGCENKAGDEKCYADSAVGECRNNPDFMLQNCAKACGKCGSCYNEFADDSACVDLARKGECTNAPEWMGKYCRKACDACEGGLTIGQVGPCQDKDNRCPQWALEKECEANPGWMIPNCQESCNRCACTNKHNEAQCEAWAARGECDSNSGWMANNCQKACAFCTNLPPPANRCSNKHTDQAKCVQWATDGECFKNPLWMIPNCRKACTKCDLLAACANWGAWSAWTGCSRTCGNGLRSRTRRCTSGPGTQDEMVGCVVVDCPTSTTAIVTSSTATPITTARPRLTTRAIVVPSTTTKGFPSPPIPTRTTTAPLISPPIPTTPTSVTTTTPTPDCENKYPKDSECEVWAQSGHCDTNPSWMIYNCARSCGRCTTTKICMNKFGDDVQCSRWATSDQCSVNPGFMLANCAKACNQCSTTPSPITTASPSSCNNLNGNDQQCSQWATAGHCTSNPGYMIKNCAKACGRCEAVVRTAGPQTSTVTSGLTSRTTASPIDPSCVDNHHLCEAWAKDARQSHCRVTTYVKNNCKKSCNLCDTPSRQNEWTEGDCQDTNPTECYAWAVQGQCVTNEEVMSAKCPFTCGLCQMD